MISLGFQAVSQGSVQHEVEDLEGRDVTGPAQTRDCARDHAHVVRQVAFFNFRCENAEQDVLAARQRLLEEET